MKVRVTFILDASKSSDWDPGQKVKFVGKKAIEIRDLRAAAREDQLTLSLDEVPKDLREKVLEHASSLHVRWQSPRQFETQDPYGSRTVPGLHVLYVPKSERDDTLAYGSVCEAFRERVLTVYSNDSSLCESLKEAFDPLLKCDTVTNAFNHPPALSPRSASAAPRQYYHVHNDIGRFADYTSKQVCGRVSAKETTLKENCVRLVDSLASADALDLDYSAASQSFTVKSTAYSPAPLAKESLYALQNGKVEVGILSLEPAAPGSTDGEDAAAKLSMGGLLGVAGEDDKLSPVLFSFPSRHHRSLAQYRVAFNAPTGLHPTMRIDFPKGTPKPPAATSKENSREASVESSGRRCALHAALSLPSALFPDKYQLAAPNLLAANGLRAVRGISAPPPDLEAPDWAVAAWGSQLIVELAPPSSSEGTTDKPSASDSSPWHAQVPLHLRYLRPAAGGRADLDVAWPAVFWACGGKDGGSGKMGGNPFDRQHVGFDAAFGPDTIFYHLTPRRNASVDAAAEALTAAAGSKPRYLAQTGAGDSAKTTPLLLETIAVPVLDTEAWAYAHLRTATAAVLLLGVAWVAWKLLYVSITNREAGGITRLARGQTVVADDPDGKGRGARGKVADDPDGKSRARGKRAAGVKRD